MPKAPTRQERQARDDAIRADRSRGLTYREIAKIHSVSRALAHRIARNVYMLSLSRWHRARQREKPARGNPYWLTVSNVFARR